MLKLILAIIWFILGLSYLVAVTREHGKKKDFKLIMLIIAGLIFIANGVYWLLEYFNVISEVKGQGNLNHLPQVITEAFFLRYRSDSK